MGKKICLVALFAMAALLGKSQSIDFKAIQTELQGIWLSHGDSISELQFGKDSLTTFRFKANGVSACTYKLMQQPCEKMVKFPASTGVYMAEHYPNRDVCCAFSLLSPTVIKIIYPDGTEVTYVSEKMLQKGQ
ncbi:MAG TPA: hypothetical protein VNZ45_17840 [Bacteroidia bacterium]|jgi:hypothetical protein|nr:hypothetical protein [Bacteroidia bacterium]